jgi:phospholipid/cholesterol/gamma-HCH transport system substrate-binding protein
VERDAKYATVAIFALVCLAAAVAFVWWYSGRGDRRDYTQYEIYFEGTVSGLSKGSPVRYLGVDVGRVQTMAVDKKNAGRVKTVVEVDSSAPVSGATQAKLGLLGLTGLLYIDLQQDPDAAGAADAPLPQGDQFPIIAARKGTIEASLEKLPDLLNKATAVMTRLDALIGDENVQNVSATLASIEQAAAHLPAITQDARALATDLRQLSASTLALTTRLQGTYDAAEPAFSEVLANARVASEDLARTAAGLDQLVNGGENGLGRTAMASLDELQQLVIDARAASSEVRDLARTLRERPSSLLREPKQSGVEIPR